MMADVTVIEAREGTELGPYKREADLPGAAWGEEQGEGEQRWRQSQLLSDPEAAKAERARYLRKVSIERLKRRVRR